MTQPSFLDYREKNIFLYTSKQGKELTPGSIVADEYNTYGYVKYVHDVKGAFIRFIDDTEVYESEIGPVSKLSTADFNHFQVQERTFKHITIMGKAIMESLKKHFKFVNMFNDGNIIFVRASTYETITKRFTTARLGDNHSFLSIKLEPLYNLEVDQFMVKKSDRGKDRFVYEVLNDLFRTIQGTKNFNRFTYEITSDDEYNKIYWTRMEHQFKKLQLKFYGFHADYQKKQKKLFRNTRSKHYQK